MAQKFDIEDVAREAGVSLLDFEKICCDRDLDDLAKLCDPWELIGHYLGMDPSHLSAIKDDYAGHTELQRIKMLLKWKESILRPTYRRLTEAFLKCGKANKALIIADKLHRSTNSRDNDIKESLRILDRKFAGVQQQLMVAAGVTLEKLQSCIATFPSFKTASPAPLIDSASIYEFFHVLKDYCNAQSPDILEDLVEALGDENTKIKWREFKQEYGEFQQRTKLKDLIGTFKGPETMPPDYNKLRVKLGDNWREKTLADLEDLRSSMALRGLLLKMIEDGSVTVVYFTPKYETYHRLNDLADYLRSKNVEQITVGEHQGLDVEEILATVDDTEFGLNVEEILAMVDDTEFDDDDWNIAFMEIKRLAASWRDIGAALGINKHRLDEIAINHHHQAADCLSAVLQDWIGQNYSVQKFGHPSWRTLCKAIQQVADNKFFKDLAKKHAGITPPEGMAAGAARAVSRPASPDKEKLLSERITNMRQLTLLECTKNGKKETINIISKAAHAWTKVADLITDDLHVVDNLRDLHRGKNEEAFKQLLRDYFIGDRPVFGGYTQDWNGLVKLLNDARLGTLASDVEEAVKSRSSQ